MKLNVKDYKVIKTKKYIQTNDFFFFVHGISQNSLDELLIKQGLQTVEFSSYKLLNKITLHTLNSSIFQGTQALIGCSTFIIKPLSSKHFVKQTLSNTFQSLFFELLVVKLNNQMYSLTSLQNLHSLNYRQAKLLFYQFNLTSLKKCSKISK
jgi:hypothetical protein